MKAQNSLINEDVKNKIYISEKYIIKQCDFSNPKIIKGFDLISEKYVEVLTKDTMVLPESVIELIKNEKYRFMLAKLLYKNIEDVSIELNISDRTTNRKYKEFGLNCR